MARTPLHGRHQTESMHTCTAQSYLSRWWLHTHTHTHTYFDEHARTSGLGTRCPPRTAPLSPRAAAPMVDTGADTGLGAQLLPHLADFACGLWPRFGPRSGAKGVARCPPASEADAGPNLRPSSGRTWPTDRLCRQGPGPGYVWGALPGRECKWAEFLSRGGWKSRGIGCACSRLEAAPTQRLTGEQLSMDSETETDRSGVVSTNFGQVLPTPPWFGDCYMSDSDLHRAEIVSPGPDPCLAWSTF